MKTYGLKLHQGTDITNTNVERGNTFPTETTPGQLFFKLDEDKLYHRNSANDDWTLLETASGSSIFLDDIIDVEAPAPTNGQALTFNTTNSRWEALTPPSGAVSSITNNSDGTYSHNNGQGTTEIIDTRANSNPYNNAIAGNLVATNVQGAIDEISDATGTTSVVTDNSDGTYTHNDGADTPTEVTIDTRASSNPFDETISNILTSTNVQDAIDEILETLTVSPLKTEWTTQQGNTNFIFPHPLGTLNVFVNGILLSSTGVTEDGTTGFILTDPVADDADVIIATSYELVYAAP